LSKTGELRLLLVDTEALERSATDDLQRGVWGSWPRLVEEFNSLNGRALALGIDSGMDPIERVPDKHLGYMTGVGAGTAHEKAKFSEVISKAHRLKQRLEIELDQMSVPKAAYDPIERLSLLCARFHTVVVQLRHRHEGRQTLDVSDEYDVQDLLHALLKLFFDDIRPEEWTPSYAGQSSRMDFLLKQDRVVIETKKTRPGLGAKEVGNQLILDIEHYKKHPDCGHLVCFVYDPDNRVANPRGLENDLSRSSEDFSVTVLIRP